MAPSEYEELVKRYRFLKEAKKLSKRSTKYQRNMVKLIAFKQETGMMPKEYLEKYQDSWHLPRHKKDGVSLEDRRRKRAEACLDNTEMSDWFKLETGSTPEDYLKYYDKKQASKPCEHKLASYSTYYGVGTQGDGHDVVKIADGHYQKQFKWRMRKSK
ncbi:hypothetical protein [Lactobacillus intestinalis]|uniref:hypothetical protein n=1 Tax=Lactobacillus intestinalis TaxID=151781 RepID=UPI001F58A839|nr:hypothetical protein [Lactobacillus intestinalis]